MGHDEAGPDRKTRSDALYEVAAREFGPALDRLASGYEADPERRRDLRQEIHFQLWRSLQRYDGRCSLRTWSFRVAHNTAVSYVAKEKRDRSGWVTLETIEAVAVDRGPQPDIDAARILQKLSELSLKLKPLDRQILLCYLEEMDAAAIAEITGLSATNVSVKTHRIKHVLARQFLQEQSNV